MGNEHPQGALRLVVIVWILLGLALGLLAQLALEYLWILGLIPALAWAAVGLVILVAALWRARRPEARRSAVLLAFGVAIGWILFIPTTWVGNSLTTRIRFALQRSTYDAVVSREASADAKEGSHQVGDLRYIVESGPPLRIAFVWPGGIIDNWCGAVYDPTGAVMRSSEFNGDWDTWSEQVPAEIIGLFGGDLLRCDELDAPYYHCCFT